MKTIRSLLALAFAAAFATSAAFADHHGKKSETKPGKAACGCLTAADGKVCGVDKDCCCTGDKAKGAAKAADAKGKGDAKKACCATGECKDGACKADKPKREKKADKDKKAKDACPPCDACPGPKADK